MNCGGGSVRASKANKKVVLIRVNSYHMKKKSVLIRELSIPKKSPQAPVLNRYFIEESPGGSLGEETHRNNKGNCPFSSVSRIRNRKFAGRTFLFILCRYACFFDTKWATQFLQLVAFWRHARRNEEKKTERNVGERIATGRGARERSSAIVAAHYSALTQTADCVTSVRRPLAR